MKDPSSLNWSETQQESQCAWDCNQIKCRNKVATEKEEEKIGQNEESVLKKLQGIRLVHNININTGSESTFMLEIKVKSCIIILHTI